MGFTPSVKLGDEMEPSSACSRPSSGTGSTISFRALDHEIILRVVDKFLMQLEEQLAEKKVEAQFTPSSSCTSRRRASTR